jgi:hypothetical protein
MRTTALMVLFVLVGACDGSAGTSDASAAMDGASVGHDAGVAPLTWIREGPANVEFRSAVMTPSENLAGGTSSSPTETTLYAASEPALCEVVEVGQWSLAGTLVQVTLVGRATGDGYERLGAGTYSVSGERAPLAGEAAAAGVRCRLEVEMEDGTVVRGAVVAPGCPVVPPSP